MHVPCKRRTSRKNFRNKSVVVFYIALIKYAWFQLTRMLRSSQAGRESAQITYSRSSSAIRLPKTYPLEKAGTVMCAGITTYQPLKHFGAGPGSRVAVVGLGGLDEIWASISPRHSAATSRPSRAPLPSFTLPRRNAARTYTSPPATRPKWRRPMARWTSYSTSRPDSEPPRLQAVPWPANQKLLVRVHSRPGHVYGAGTTYPWGLCL